MDDVGDALILDDRLHAIGVFNAALLDGDAAELFRSGDLLQTSGFRIEVIHEDVDLTIQKLFNDPGADASIGPSDEYTHGDKNTAARLAKMEL